ncbi:MAG: hypothetical protein ACRYFU_19795 [Janthinobacterium lividum]
MPQTAIQNETERVEQILSPPPSFSRHQFARSLAWLAVIPVVVYVLTFPFVMIPSLGFSRLSISKFGPVLDYGFEAHDVNADVVIFGDSSAFIGIDPRIVNAELGVKTMVIPNTVGSLPVLNGMPLKTYLAHNKAPRLLVMYFSAWNLNYNDSRRKDFLFEGEEMLLRHGSMAEIAQFVHRKPLELLTFPFKVYSTLGWNNFSYAIHHRYTKTGNDVLGHMDFAFTYPPMASPCKIPATYLAEDGDASVRSLVGQFANAGTKVEVYLAPMPECSNTNDILHRSFRDVGAARPIVLPPSWFVGDDSDAHIRPAQVGANSRLFAMRLRPQIQALGIAPDVAPQASVSAPPSLSAR